MKKILVLTCIEDVHTAAVSKKIKEKYDIEPVILEREAYGKGWTVSALVKDSGVQTVIELPSCAVEIDEIGSFWNRRDFTVQSNMDEASAESKYVATQTAIHVNGAMRQIANRIVWVNHPDANSAASSKLTQADVAIRNGLTYPPSFFGSSPSLADNFIRSVNIDHRISIKPLEAVHLKAADGNTYAHYNSIFRRRGIEELSSLAECPVILQQFIEKRLELRVTVVGEDIFAASIDTSQASEEAKTDWRHYDWANTPYHQYKLPDDLRSRLIGVMRDLRLTYGAFDLILGDDGKFYFLEVNPQGQWLWVEDLTELPITECLADYLYSHAHG